MTDSYVATLERMAHECESGGHQLCAETRECRIPLDRALSSRARREEASNFDAGEERLRLQASQPADTWSTSALLRTAKDLLLTPPTNDPWWRSIAITSSLARLGERGLGADAIVRSGFARDLVGSIVRDAALYWCASALDDVVDVDVPIILQPWVELLDSDPSLISHRTELPSHVASVALAGTVGAEAEEWIRSAAVAHILGWRVKDYLRVERQPRDLVLPGGKDVTLWVTDRFTRTYVPEWRSSSLHWEHMYNSDPAQAARVAGVPLAILRERTVTAEMLTGALRVRLIDHADEEFEQRELGDSSIASLATLLDSGQHRAALEMARRFHEAHPQATHFAMAYAFCLIATDPSRARATLDSFDPPNSVAVSIRAVNLATCALMASDLATARKHVGEISDEGNPTAWLWEPVSVVSEEPRVRYLSIRDWVERFSRAEAMLTR
jgi:hypothetical protein